MSIVKMQKMSLVAHSGERTRLLRIFIKLGCVELIKSEENILVTPADKERREEMENKKFRAVFCMSFLREMSKEIVRFDKKEAPKIDLKKENRLVPLEEYEEVCNNTEEIFAKIDEMESINNRIVDLRSEKTRLTALKEQILPYRNLKLDMSKVKDSAYTSVFCGLIPADKKERIKTTLKELVEQKPDLPVYCEFVSSSDSEYAMKELAPGFACVERAEDGKKQKETEKTYPLVVVCMKEEGEDVLRLLSESDFVRTSFNFDNTPEEKIAATDERMKEIDETVKSLIMGTKQYVKYIPTVKIIYDFYALELAKLDVTENSARTKKAIAFEGWVPEDKVETLKQAIDEKCSRVEYSFREPTDDETPPTATKNSKVVGAFAGITEMFGVPNYRERDPNLFVALFYFLIFGIMIGDAGYGLIMAIACFVFTAIKKPVKNSGRMIIMFGFCGISTFIWGILFGGWFAIEFPEDSIFMKMMWFSPLNEPLKMFMLSLGIGVLQIGTGFALNGIARIKTKKPVEIVKGILSDFGWVWIFIGLLCLFPNILVYLGAIEGGAKWFKVAGSIGTTIAICGAVMMLIGGAVGKKNPIKAVGGSLGSLYGAINVVSDLLSYSRLFGLGLTTGVIGLVMNKLGMIIVDMAGPVGWIFAVIIFIGGHIFNLAINLLGAYVHDSRLQYIEFFGRFYEGSGHAFKPLGGQMKYTYLDN